MVGYFEKHPRKRSKLVEASEALHQNVSNGPENGGSGSTLQMSPPTKAEPAREDRPREEDAAKLRQMEANSGIAFTRLLGLRLDPSSGPKLFTFGWNLGTSTHEIPFTPSITEYLDQVQMYRLAKFYFANVHPLWGFLDQSWTMEQLTLRWTRPELCKIPDHMLAGVAALGALWSKGEFMGILPQLVDLAKRSLEATSTMQPSSLVDVQSWNLRSLYLRLTDHPHATWLSTCTTMHLVESTGIHHEESTHSIYAPAHESPNDADIRRRTFWVARMLNTWVSFEYGRTRVALRGVTCQLPTPRPGDFTVDYINLYSISCCLDPERSNEAAQWEEFLRQLEDYEVKHDGIMLSKANLALCGYRRIRLASPILSQEITQRIINIGLNGLEAARRMADTGQVWWHTANVPFQVVCVFLAMDVRESLSNLATAMRTLEFVVHKFPTVAMREALKTARFLVRLSKKRKDEDSDVLGQTLQKASRDGVGDSDPQPENLQPRASFSGQTNGSRPMMQMANATNTASATLQHAQAANSGVGTGPGGLQGTPFTNSSEDWNMDALNTSDFDWNYFLTTDMPAFQNFAPDGTM